MKVAGTLLQVVDMCHVLFLTDFGEKLWVATLTQFEVKNIGQRFTFELDKRFQIQSIFKNENGRYKLIEIAVTFDGVPSLRFIDNQTGEKIVGHLNRQIGGALINTFLLGSFFDLSLLNYYKGINSLPDLPGNESSGLEPIVLLNLLEEDHFLTIYRGETAFVSCGNQWIPYLGTPILSELYPKYWNLTVSPKDQLDEWKIEKFTFLCSITKSMYMFVKDMNNKKYAYLNTQMRIISNINLNVELTLGYADLKVGLASSLQESPTGRNQLLDIMSYDDGQKFSIFKDIVTSDIFAVNFVNETLKSTVTKIGSFFDFENLPQYYLTTFEATDDSNTYLLQNILDNQLYIFLKDGIRYAIRNDISIIADSKIGKYFKLEFIDSIYAYQVDATQGKK